MQVRRAYDKAVGARQVSVRGVGIIWALSILGREEIRGVGSRGQAEGQEEPLGLRPPLAVWDRKLSKSLCQLPVKPGPRHRPRAPSGRVGHTNLVAEAGMGGRHGGVKHVHLLQFHVTIELLQLGGLHALQLREVVLGKALELAVHMVWVKVPVVVCRR